jgi:hypothetical protein
LHRLCAAGEAPTIGDLAKPHVEYSPQSIPWVADSLAKDPDFIMVGFHIGRFVTAVVNTKAERGDIQGL